MLFIQVCLHSLASVLSSAAGCSADSSQPIRAAQDRRSVNGNLSTVSAWKRRMDGSRSHCWSVDGWATLPQNSQRCTIQVLGHVASKCHAASRWHILNADRYIPDTQAYVLGCFLDAAAHTLPCDGFIAPIVQLAEGMYHDGSPGAFQVVLWGVLWVLQPVGCKIAGDQGAADGHPQQNHRLRAATDHLRCPQTH